MPEQRRRPAREKARFEMLVMAERWFATMLDQYNCARWDLVEEWGTLSVSVKIRRFMQEVRSGHPVACEIYSGSSAELDQSPSA